MTKVVKFLLFVPAIVMFVALLRPDLLLNDDLLSVTGLWALSGTLFSYYGFVFSLFALLEVRALSQRYFTKQRLPEIKKRIDLIVKDVYGFGENEFVQIRSQGFMSQIPVMIRQIRKTRVAELAPVAKRLELAHGIIKKRLGDGYGLGVACNKSDYFWELHGILTELSDEIDEHNKGAMASL